MTIKPTITPGTPGAARVEYFACREDVEALLVRGYSARMAYEQMKEEDRVTCSYSAFCDYVRGGGKRKHSSGRKKPQAGFTSLPKPTPQIRPRIVATDREKLTDPRSIDPASIF